MKTDLHLALTFPVGRNAEIDIHGLAYGIADIKGTIVLQLQHAAEDDHENGHKGAPHQQGDKDEHGKVANGMPQTHASPAHTEKKIDDIAEREEVHGTGIIGSIAADISIHGSIKVMVTHAEEGQDGLCHKDKGGENG